MESVELKMVVHWSSLIGFRWRRGRLSAAYVGMGKAEQMAEERCTRLVIGFRRRDMAVEDGQSTKSGRKECCSWVMSGFRWRDGCIRWRE